MIDLKRENLDLVSTTIGTSLLYSWGVLERTEELEKQLASKQYRTYAFCLVSNGYVNLNIDTAIAHITVLKCPMKHPIEFWLCADGSKAREEEID